MNQAASRTEGPVSFEEETKALLASRIEMVTWVCIALTIPFAIADLQFEYSIWIQLFRIKVAIISVYIFGIVLLRSPIGREHGFGGALAGIAVVFAAVTAQANILHETIVVPIVTSYAAFMAAAAIPWGAAGQVILGIITMTCVVVNAVVSGESASAVLGYGQVAAYGAIVSSIYVAGQFQQQRFAVWRERNKAERLLINVFPEAVIPRLKDADGPIADEIEDVTVVFADIVGFTPLSERVGAKRMVELLDELFLKFDTAAARLRVEKIETTGDGYLAAAGAPTPLEGHPRAVAELALAMINAAEQTRISETESIEIRVGIHTGPIMAGVIGRSRFHYKIFGATVNTASRVQAAAEPGQILVSDATFARLHDSCELEDRGIVDLKGHGPMRLWRLLKGDRTGESASLTRGCRDRAATQPPREPNRPI